MVDNIRVFRKNITIYTCIATGIGSYAYIDSFWEFGVMISSYEIVLLMLYFISRCSSKLFNFACFVF